MGNWWARNNVREAIQHGLGLNNWQIDAISERVLEVLDRRRLTIVPSYLGDEMYEAQRDVDPLLSYNMANHMWTAAVSQYNSNDEPPVKKVEESSELW